MDAYWFQKLIDVLRIQTNGENEKLMILYLDKELRKLKLPYHIDAAGNVIVTKGKAKAYPCVVSHMDTVHSFVPDFGVYQDKDNSDTLFALNGKKRVGIGGDDKCGVFACLYLLKVIPQIKVVFFSREESGCKGSTSINKRFFADCRYLIQLDRRGKRDFIQTYWGNKTISHEFSSEIGLIKKKYKYKNKIGTVTDVMKLWDNKVGVSCINLSCGYYNPHTDSEYISINALWHSIKFTEEIISTIKPKRYISLPPPPTIVKTQTNFYNQGSGSSKCAQCYKCKAWKKEALLYTHWDSKTNKMEGFCYSCKKEMYPLYSEKEKKHNSILTDKKHKNTVLFACSECGIKTSEMETGDSLKYVNGELYCNECASIFFVDKIDPKECFVCNKVIPKDHEIIERFGVRVCEDCACPSDIVITEDEVNKKHIRELEQEN